MGFLGPRIRHGLTYMLAGGVGLGTWASGVDRVGNPVQGLIVEVSVHPGVEICGVDRVRRSVPLNVVPQLSEWTPPSTGFDQAWREAAVRDRFDVSPSQVAVGAAA